MEALEPLLQRVDQLDPRQLLALALFAGAILGGLLAAWLAARAVRRRALAREQLAAQAAAHERHELQRRQEQLVNALQEARSLAAEQAQRLANLAAERARLEGQLEQLGNLRETLAARDVALQVAQRENTTQAAQIARLQAELGAERESSADKLKLLENAREQLTAQFQNLANRILEEKTARFTAHNREQLGHLLNPLREQLGDFRKKVEDVYDRETRDRTDLKAQITQLRGLNERISKDAINLTNALKGESKTRGNWGEVVLERVLEDSGLRLGHEYRREVVLQSEDGSRLRPDVIIDLPDDRHIVIDSKVSLAAYERAAAAEEETVRRAAQREHVASLRSHIRALGGKDYATLHGLRSLDFVLLFIPIEGAFHAALVEDGGLYAEAYKQNIVLVSPTTLLATCRTIENIWRIEQHNRNADEIARQAGAMLDKFNGFVADLEKVGEQLERAHKAYESARNKLDQGRGNLLRSAHRIAELGVKAKKALPESPDSDPAADPDLYIATGGEADTGIDTGRD